MFLTVEDALVDWAAPRHAKFTVRGEALQVLAASSRRIFCFGADDLLVADADYELLLERARLRRRDLESGDELARRRVAEAARALPGIDAVAFPSSPPGPAEFLLFGSAMRRVTLLHSAVEDLSYVVLARLVAPAREPSEPGEVVELDQYRRQADRAPASQGAVS